MCGTLGNVYTMMEPTGQISEVLQRTCLLIHAHPCLCSAADVTSCMVRLPCVADKILSSACIFHYLIEFSGVIIICKTLKPSVCFILPTYLITHSENGCELEC